MQHAVDVFVAVGATKCLGELDAFIDDDTIGHVEAVLEFVFTYPQNRVFHRRNLGHGPVKQGRDASVKGDGVTDAAVEECVVVGRICLVETDQIAGERINRIRFIAAHQMLVQRLQRKFACAGTARDVPHPNAVRLALERARHADQTPPPVDTPLSERARSLDVTVPTPWMPMTRCA